MSLAFRLLIAFAAVAVLATALVGWSARETAREMVEEGFDARIDAATHGAELSLEWEVQLLQRQLLPLCAHGTFVDKALVDYERALGDVSALDPGSRIAMRHHVPEEAAARNLDELVLATDRGFILAATDLARIGTVDDRVKERLAEAQADAPTLRRDEGGAEEAWMEIHCTRREGRFAVGLLGARRINPILERVGEATDVELTWLPKGVASPASGPSAVVRVIDIPKIEGLRVAASVSREPLRRTLERLDQSITLFGAVAVLLAILVAIALARSSSGPIVALARETREVVTGEPRPVRARGSREIRQLAESFNRTIDELTAMRRRLAATERIAARREVARQVAHEIKNPLAPIRAAVETLRRLRAREDPAFDEYFDEATKTVLEEVHRITNIVTEFTKFARLPAPSPAPMDLVAAVRSVVALHDRSTDVTGGGALDGDKRAAKVKVELSVEPLPEVNADRDQMIQVVTNLVQNAIDAALEGGAEPRVVVTVGPKDDRRARIVVRDNGPGVDEAMVDRLFEPYATSKDHGTGLGLAIVQRIVFEHGGEISYRPATKGGAVFEVVLPVAGPSLLDRPLATDVTNRPAPMTTAEPDAGSRRPEP